MIEYNYIAYQTPESAGICPLNRWEKTKDMTKIQIYCLMDFCEEELEELIELYTIDKRWFADAVKDYIEMSPKNVCN